MAKGRAYSAHQQKIIRRYYENRDTIALQKLSEIVTELYLCTTAKKAERLWDQVEKQLPHTEANPAQMKQVLAKRDVTALAELVNTLTV